MRSPKRAPTRGIWTLAVALGLAAGASVPQCAKSQCQINSDCGARRYCDDTQVCRSDCAEDRDCPGGTYCDINGRCAQGTAPIDASPDVPTDAVPDALPMDTLPPVDIVPPTDTLPPVDAVTPTDTFVPPDVPVPPPDVPVTTDVPPPPPDVPAARGAFLDPCASPLDCASGDCANGVGTARFCTRACSSRRDCGDGFLCAIPPGLSTGRCLPDDTGTPCDLTTAEPCRRYCYAITGSAAVAHCTRECANGADCPAGFACQSVTTSAGTTAVCVSVERPCARAAECPSGLCLPTVGCTAQCRSANDCPARIPGLTPYSCAPAGGGINVCNPPRSTNAGAMGYVAGADPMGTTCNATGVNTCRSAVCDDTEAPPVCVEHCSVTGGCPAGWGCRPWVPDPTAPTEFYLVCRLAGSGAIGSVCTRGADCATALCQGDSSGGPTGYCTRLCSNDHLCPTGMRCALGGSTVDGAPISICVR